MAVLLLALIATGAGEYSREMLRKPYVIGHWMYSNGVRVPYVARINQEGYLAHSMWVWQGPPLDDSSCRRATIHWRTIPITVTPAAKPSSAASAAPATRSTATARSQLLAGRDRANIASFITMLHDYKPDSPYRRFMPPMVGTKQDIDDLADYLNAQVNPPAPAAQKPVQTAQK